MRKMALILLGILLFFGLFVFGPFYDDLNVQAVLLALIILWNALKTSWSQTWSLLKSVFVFLISLLAFGLFFQLVHLQGRSDWLYDTIVKCLVFPNSLLFLRTMLGYVTYLDILSWPLSLEKRFYLITYKAAFDKGGHALERFRWYLDGYPYLAQSSGFKRQLGKYASLIVSLYLYLYEETENARLLLDNRYRHLAEHVEPSEGMR